MITRLARTARIRRRPIFFVTGVLLMVLDMAWPATMAFVPGMLVLALGVPDARPRSPEAAMVSAWAWSRERRADHR
jgi:hypothetical protein